MDKLISHTHVKYVIVQAGGKGTRMGRYTANKPKCMVPVRGVTMIENTLNTFAHCKTIVIGDYLYETLDAYLKTQCAHLNYELIRTHQQGTAAGIDQALALIPPGEPFALTWSDLFWESAPQYTFETDILIALTDDFECRWSMQNAALENIASSHNGVAGFYVFKDSQCLSTLTTAQSLVRGFLAQYPSDRVSTFKLNNCFEVGQVEHYETLIQTHRFFNKVEITEHTVTKTCTVPGYQQLLTDEIAWYGHVNHRVRMPEVLCTTPLTLQRIKAQHAFDIEHNRKQIVNNYCELLHTLHSLESKPANYVDCESVYETKPKQRVAAISTLIPRSDQKEIKINNKWCKNVLHSWDFPVIAPRRFVLIHGDPTFSNTLVDDRLCVWFIDPRGSFGSTKLWGDAAYDWAKFYYSAVGNYDSINRKKFSVQLDATNIQLNIHSSGYELYADQILSESGLSQQHMNYVHAGIWLSLSGYVTEDLDAMMFAFYQGVYLWNQL